MLRSACFTFCTYFAVLYFYYLASGQILSASVIFEKRAKKEEENLSQYRINIDARGHVIMKQMDFRPFLLLPFDKFFIDIIHNHGEFHGFRQVAEGEKK